ncbi:hypothetical protein Bca52824_075064 [Brassica carinata]|uniref:Uncharacterized protein n=1 Tax=Brassica carinata TaxID=52824 RepID=A0A8X7PQF7_BRACI|nr:hypothetical protein Bca52824_075064 [Brassica carinata]
MVSLKVLQSDTCSEDRDLARSSSSTPHGSRQLPTDGLATKEAGHKQREETSSEIILDGSGAEGTVPSSGLLYQEGSKALIFAATRPALAADTGSDLNLTTKIPPAPTAMGSNLAYGDGSGSKQVPIPISMISLLICHWFRCSSSYETIGRRRLA